MKNNKVILLLICISLSFLHAKHSQKTPPQLTVVIVIDQFAYHYIPKIKNHFKFGLKKLFKKGVVYEKTYHPHGVPETTPGHNGLSTGTTPKDHGAIANDWIGLNGEEIEYEIDPKFPSLNPEDKNGYSNKKTRVDGLSDQFIYSSKFNGNHKVFSLSLKSYPAISMAGRLGKAIWFDQESGNFTSSTAYFKQLPKWIEEFNQLKKTEKYREKIWKTIYPENSKAYDFPLIKNYEYAGIKEPMIGSNSNKIIPQLSPQAYHLFIKTPFSSNLLLKLAKRCLQSNFNPKSKDKMILWISLSNLDLLCHIYGPHSIETIDLIYQIDKQLGCFIKYLKKSIGKRNYLIALTADHGICPIPEIAKKQGYYSAKRIMGFPLIKQINKLIAEKHGIKDLVLNFEPTYYRLEHKILDDLSNNTKQEIYKTIKNFLRTITGIKNVWTFDELINSTFEPYQLENFYKTQLYKGRSGDIICQAEPYCQLTKYSSGTSHSSPYDYDTHVPLVIYQKGRFKHQQINEKVWIQQLPVTLAKILNVDYPNASTYNLLPGLKI